MLSSVYEEDLRQITEAEEIPWAELKDTTVLATGATGLIGSALVYGLAAANNTRGLGIRIIAHGRDTEKGAALADACGARWIRGDIRQPIPVEDLPLAVDYIVHCAEMTRSADMAARPTDVIDTAVDGARNMLALAAQRHCQSFLYLSSMEVYGRTDLREVRETDIGYLDLASSRSCYPESKRMGEAMCAAYLTQYGVPARIARLAQTFGAGTPKDDTRVFAQFARSLLAGTDIILHTEGQSMGNYCYTADAVRALLLILLRGEDGQAYNVANPDASMMIREMAELVTGLASHGSEAGHGGEARHSVDAELDREAALPKISVKVEMPADAAQLGYAPDSGHKLNVDKLKNLGWQPKYGLADMYKRLMDDWKAIN